jgi:Do/DeqQ family serine protease
VKFMSIEFRPQTTPNKERWQLLQLSQWTGLLMLLVFVGSCAEFSKFQGASGNSTTTQETQAPNPDSPELSSQGPLPENSNFIVEAVHRTGPAVVRIDASRTVKTGVPEEFNDPAFRQFFGGDSPFPAERTEEGSGSGFIIRENGVILTNAHVVENADRVTVKLKDGRSFEGQVVGQDQVTDVAVVKIDADSLPVVTLGNSDQLQPGEWAIAMGNPLGLDNTVTVGIISATGRTSNEIGVPDKRIGFIQTDAAINPGNSGGPLLNAQGEVIGMNTAIIDGAQGLGFSIPINTAQGLAEQLITNGRVEHPFLGVQMVTLTPDMAQRLKADPNNSFVFEEQEGVLVIEVLQGSPADSAGFRAGDLIKTIGGKPVKTAEEVQQRVAESKVGQPLAIQVNRGGKPLELSVIPKEFPTAQQ